MKNLIINNEQYTKCLESSDPDIVADLFINTLNEAPNIYNQTKIDRYTTINNKIKNETQSSNTWQVFNRNYKRQNSIQTSILNQGGFSISPKEHANMMNFAYIQRTNNHKLKIHINIVNLNT